jgi:hypothetical protein
MKQEYRYSALFSDIDLICAPRRGSGQKENFKILLEVHYPMFLRESNQ